MRLKKKTVPITDDVIIDHHIYEGRRNVCDSIRTIGPYQKKTHVSAGLFIVSDLVRNQEKAIKNSGF